MTFPYFAIGCSICSFLIPGAFCVQDILTLVSDRNLKTLFSTCHLSLFMMFVCVFCSLWPCRSLFFEGVGSRDALGGWV